MKDRIRIGCGAGFSGDRLEPGLILAQRGQLDYLVLECLAERTSPSTETQAAQSKSRLRPLIRTPDRTFTAGTASQ